MTDDALKISYKILANLLDLIEKIRMEEEMDDFSDMRFTEDEFDLNEECKECGEPLLIHRGLEFCPEVEMCEFCDLPLDCHNNLERCKN